MEGAGEPVLLEEGDCFLLPHGLPFQVASDLSLPADDWRRHFVGSPEGTVVKLNGGSGVTVLGSHFAFAGPQAEMLLGHAAADRPSARRDRSRDAALGLRSDAAGTGRFPSREASSSPSTSPQMIFVQALRLHLGEGKGVGWLSALSDKRVGAAITAIHREPARRWTVELLAVEVGMSRSSFAARFQATGRRRPDRISHPLANAARRTQPVARRTHRYGRPHARV